MSLEEKRSFYKCGDGYVTLSSIPTWEEMAKSVNTIDGEMTIIWMFLLQISVGFQGAKQPVLHPKL